MGHVVPHIIEAYMIHRKLIDSYGETCPKTNKQIKYSPIVRDPNASYNKLNMTATINNYQQFKHKNNCAADIWSYMEGLEVAGTGDAEYACTWLELYILYRMRGYGKPIKDNRSKARARACVLSQLNCFKRTFRGVAKRALCHKEELDLFKPLKIKHERFLGLGVQGKHAGFACCVLLSGAEAKQIERQIILLGRKLAESKLRQFMGGEITLEPHIPTMKGRAAWDSNIKICVNYKNKDPSTVSCCHLKVPSVHMNLSTSTVPPAKRKLTPQNPASSCKILTMLADVACVRLMSRSGIGCAPAAMHGTHVLYTDPTAVEEARSLSAMAQLPVRNVLLGRSLVSNCCSMTSNGRGGPILTWSSQLRIC